MRSCSFAERTHLRCQVSLSAEICPGAGGGGGDALDHPGRCLQRVLLLPACREKVGIGRYRESEAVETPPHQAEIGISSLPCGPLPASGAREAVLTAS
jgi:hypothetical protein